MRCAIVSRQPHQTTPESLEKDAFTESSFAVATDARTARSITPDETGFGDPDRMRRAFVRTLGQPPQTIRRVARQQAA